MEEVETFIKSELKKYGFGDEMDTKLRKFIKRNNALGKEELYTKFLNSVEHPAFQAILNNETVFDATIYIKNVNSWYDVDEISKNINEKLKPDYLYVSKTFIGAKLNKECFDTMQKLNKLAVPYHKIWKRIRKYVESFDNVRFGELFFDVKKHDDHQKYLELVGHLKGINLPISIVDDEFVTGERGTCIYSDVHQVNLTLEDRDWPKDKTAIKCAKTAFYCYLFKRTSHKCFITKDYLALKFQKSTFMVKINEEEKLLVEFRKLIQKKSDSWKDNVKMVKKFMSYHGFFPNFYSDYLIEIICMEINEEFCGSFFRKFLKYDCKMKTFSLDSNEVSDSDRFSLVSGKNKMVLESPDSVIRGRLKSILNFLNLQTFQIFDSTFNLISEKYLIPNLNDFDAALSKIKRTNFFKMPVKFLDCIVSVELEKLSPHAYFFYSVPLKLILIKAKTDIDLSLLINVVALKTGYSFGRKIRAE